jgi:hypothetical protein
MGSIRSMLALVAIAAVVVACGGSSGTAAPKATAAASAASGGSDVEASAETEGSGDSDTGGGSSGGDASIPKIGDASYKSGTANVKISGEKSLDLQGEISENGALTIGGATVLQYALPTEGGFIQISFLQDESSTSGIALADGDFILAGTWGEDCDVKVTRNDGSGLAGDFVCKGLTGADSKLAKAYQVDMTGSFSADK